MFNLSINFGKVSYFKRGVVFFNEMNEGNFMEF